MKVAPQRLVQVLRLLRRVLVAALLAPPGTVPLVLLLAAANRKLMTKRLRVELAVLEVPVHRLPGQTVERLLANQPVVVLLVVPVVVLVVPVVPAVVVQLLLLHVVPAQLVLLCCFVACTLCRRCAASEQRCPSQGR